MTSKIIKKEKNVLLQREEIILEMHSQGAPSFEAVKKEIGKDESVVVIKKIEGNFGTDIFHAKVFVYDSPDARKRFEVIPKKIKKKIAEEAKAKKEADKKAAEAEAKSAEVAPQETAETPTETLVEQPSEEVKEKTPEETKPEEKKNDN